MNLKYEIKPENLKVLEVKQVALDKDKFGALTFDRSYPKLNELRKVLVELDELGYRDLLTADEITEIDNYKNRLLQYVQRIYGINPATDASFNKNVRDQIENEVEVSYNNTMKAIRNNLVYLRQEASRKRPGGEELAEQQKAAVQAEQKYKELAEKLESRFQKLDRQEKGLEEKRKQVEAGHGEVAAKLLAVQFAKQVQEYETAAVRWLSLRNILYWTLIGIIGANFIVYLLLFTFNRTGLIRLAPTDIFTIEYGVVKLALLAVLSYGVGFASKNYNVNSHLAAVNKHRRNVAQTLEDFLATNPDRKSEMLRQGTEAMFKHFSVGYIRKEEQKDSGPIYEIASKFLPNKE